MALNYMRFLVSIVLAIFIFSLATAQKISISGIVNDTDSLPIFSATVSIPEISIGTFTNDKGEFTLLVPYRTLTLEIRSLGYKTETLVLSEIRNPENFTIILEEDLLSLDEVVVTAKKTQTLEGTSVYKIESQAIKQVQAMNLSDVLSLLPGNAITPPDLNQDQQANLRTAIESKVNSFGTSIILDGAVLNNDANFQAKNPTVSFSGGNATAGSGVDLRTVSLANIESVEVISGVASPKYGNLSTGGILVKSKVGVSPWITTANVTSTNYQASVVKGFSLKKYGLLNSNFSYAYSSGSPTELKTYYQTYNLGLRWKLPKLPSVDWDHFTSFRVVYSDDGNRHDPDEVFRDEADVKSTNYQFGLSGDIKLYSFFEKISYNFNSSINIQNSFFDETVETGPFPIIEATESGTYNTTFTPNIFNQITRINGKAINFNARIGAQQFFETGNLSFSLETGIQYDLSDNTGDGRVFTGNNVLPSTGSVDSSLGNRSTNLREIPASKTFSAYHQTSVKKKGKIVYNLISAYDMTI
ncbi:MAG: carboxypeptidase-like regulatory domain-containing protein [Bacteroidota bacterium]